MKRRSITRLTLMSLLSVAMLTSLPGAVATDEGSHVMYIRGISNLSQQCEYEWKDNSGLPGLQPIRDELGIPQPVMYADGPHCRDGNPSVAGIQPVACSLARNTGPYKPPDRNADLTQGEVGLKPPCMGQISANDVSGLTGCVAVGTSGISECGISSPTWYYGYCGQTYGGAQGGTFNFGGKTWTINRMGFPRGRGAWEFNGRMTSNTTGHVTQFRYYLGAAPDQPNQVLGCDVTNNLTSIVFTGKVIVPAPPARVIRTKPGWHWCDVDLGFSAGTPGENC